MSDIQPASFEDLKKAWDFYRQRIDRTNGKEEVNYRTYRLEFLRGMEEIEKADKIEALRDAAESYVLIDHMYREYDYHPLRHTLAPANVRATSSYLHTQADLLEGDE